MRTLLLLSSLIVFFWNGEYAAAGLEDWTLRRDENGIQVYTRAVVGSPYDEVLTTTVVDNLRLASLVAVLQDPAACPRWVHHCSRSHLLSTVSEREVYVYSYNDMPFPIRDREIISHVLWSQDPVNRSLTMTGTAVDGFVDRTPGSVRLTEARVAWRFQPLAGGRIRITNRAHLNPGSRIPAWLTNNLLVETPFLTMSAFISLARTSDFREAKASFVSEPSVFAGAGSRQEPGIDSIQIPLLTSD
ncbi:MAG: START domain-containing protein [Gammaproteobacteria bacterium]|nr:hypothetical protein [Pseudomonadales bacterium]MCP5348545.1 hypothetical protein [Pseudomonadales bacterium]